jgi:hypothetical protein
MVREERKVLGGGNLCKGPKAWRSLAKLTCIKERSVDTDVWDSPLMKQSGYPTLNNPAINPTRCQVLIKYTALPISVTGPHPFSFWQCWGLNLWPHYQMLYHLNHTPRPFAFSLFFQTGSHAFALGCDPPTSTSWLLGITDVLQHSQCVFWDKVSLTFLPKLYWNCNTLICSSQVTGIIPMSHPRLALASLLSWNSWPQIENEEELQGEL